MNFNMCIYSYSQHCSQCAEILCHPKELPELSMLLLCGHSLTPPLSPSSPDLFSVTIILKNTLFKKHSQTEHYNILK